MNRRNIYLVSLISLAMGFVGCEKKLDNDMKKASYAIGQQIGQNLKSQNIDFDSEVLAMSMKEVAEGKQSKMKPEELQAAIQKLQENVMKKQTEQAETNLKDGKKFLEENKSKPGVKTTESGLQYTVEKEGDGKTPTANDMVKAHYKGTLTNGTQFDSSYDRGQPAEFPVNGVIKGWTEALQMMKVGGKLKLFIPPELGYGSSPRPNIPANSVLLFDVELVDVMPAPQAAKGVEPAPAAKKTKKKK